MESPVAGDAQQLLAILGSGLEPPEDLVTVVLRHPACPRAVVERLVQLRSVLGSRRIVQLLVRHPACPRQFAWDALPRLGWHDLVEVCRDQRASPAIRRQSERKLVERIATLTRGERSALARLGFDAVISALLDVDDPRCVSALMDNPHFTHSHALRLAATGRWGPCLVELLRHPVWGKRREILRTALQARALPLGVALGLLTTLEDWELESVAREGSGVRDEVRTAAAALVARRRARGIPEGAPPS
jgi:hypothetical protein